MSNINIADIRVDGGTQSRAAIDRGVVSDYADAIKDGATFPPITVFFDGRSYWLGDGFHRYEAYAAAQVYDVPADIRQGTQRDAILFSVGANASHGLRRTNDDKRRAVLTLLNDPEWSKWSDREVARQCGVSNRFVSNLRPSVNGSQMEAERTVTRNGTTYQQNTANIGTSSKADQIAPEPETPALPEAVAPEPAPASNADQEPAEPIDPAEAKERREIARMPDEAKADEIIGLRADLRDEKAKNARLKKERDDLSSRLAEALATDQGRTISLLQKQLQAAKFSRDEAMSSAKRMEYRLKKAEARVKELESMEVSFP